MIMTKKQAQLDCFGDIHTVFPMQADGLRAVPEACMRCKDKTACLRKALSGRDGVHVREEMIDRAYRGGIVGFLQRWSQKKSLNRLK